MGKHEKPQEDRGPGVRILFEIETGNAAFEENGEWSEIARIMRTVSDRLRLQIPDYVSGTHSIPLMDYNGNTVGACLIEEVK